MRITVLLSLLLALTIGINEPAFACQEILAPGHDSALEQAPPYISTVYQQVVEDFSIYQQFLQSEYDGDGHYTLVNAHNYQEAYSLLRQGFIHDLALDIYSACCLEDEIHNRLLLQGSDGLPGLESGTPNGIRYCRQNDRITFHQNFFNCYAPGDAWLYTVEVQNEQYRWKIRDISLRQLNRA